MRTKPRSPSRVTISILSAMNTAVRSAAFVVSFWPFLMAVTPAAAQELWKPPNVYGSLPGGLKASVTDEIITRLRVGDMTVSLDETPIENVRAKFAATIGSTGDAAESFTWICAQGTDPDGRWALWLAHGEDGDNVDSFQWRRLFPHEKADGRCPILAQSARGVELPGPIRLGTVRRQVLVVLGRPTVEQENTLVYVHEHPASIHGQNYTSHNSVVILLRQGAVYAIAAHKYKIWE